MPFRLNLRSLPTALLGLLAVLLPAQALPVDQVRYAALSPDGHRIAFIERSGLFPDLSVQDADNLNAPTKILVRGKLKEEGYWLYNKGARQVIWASNDLLVVDYGYTVESINLDGKKVATLGERLLRKAEPNNPDSTQILVMTDIKDRELAIVDARTGARRKFKISMPGKPVSWAFDSKGELRAISLSTSEYWNDATTITHWYKPLGSNPEWQKLETFKVTDNYWLPAQVPDADNQLLIYSSIGRDTTALFRYDTRTHEIGEMVAGHPTQDLVVADGLAGGTLRSVVTDGMLPEQTWFDASWKRVQRLVKASLPGAVTMLDGDPEGRVIVFAYSDVDPGRWYMLDTKTLEMRILGAERSLVIPKFEQPMQIRQYAARDGLTIPAYLTLPAKAEGPQPTVIMIHGGPAVRDYWGWDRDVQMLAKVGYAVFQPQFRGSDGFGRAFREAGYGQWGLAMQDDITDGVEYLIKEGIADPKRICILGASYGGYAALWGLVKTPDLYRCGISVAGVSDIEYMFHDNSDRTDSTIVREIMRFRIGDAKLNKAQFDAVSPLKHADQIKAPVLLIHGDLDERVPISHGKKMRAALIEQRKTYEWLELAEQGHEGIRFSNRAIYNGKLLDFLKKYIGTAPAVAPSKPASPPPADKQAEAAQP